MKIKDYNDAIEFFRTNDFRAADGAWSEFYQSEVQEPRIMDLADGGRIRFGKGKNLDRAAYKEIRPITQANIDNYTYFTSIEEAKPYKFKVQLPSGTEVFKTKEEAQAAIDAAPITNRDYTEGLIDFEVSEGSVEFDAGRIKTPTGEYVGTGRDKAQIFKIQNKDGSGKIRYTAVGAGGGKKKLYDSIEEVKKAKLDFTPDELVKVGKPKKIKQNINEITYKNKKTGKIVKYYKPMIGVDKITIEGKGAETLKEAEEFVKNHFEKNPRKPHKSTAKLEKDLKALYKDPRIKKIIESGRGSPDDIEIVQKIIGGTERQAQAKLAQLADALSPDGERVVDGIEKLPRSSAWKADNIFKFHYNKDAAKELEDMAIGKSVGEPSLKTLRKDIQKTLPFEGGIETYSVDEAKARAGSYRLGSKPYSIFGQVIDGGLNSRLKMAVDSRLSLAEENLQKNLKKNKNIKKAVDKYNAIATEAENIMNKETKKGFKKVKVPRITLASPSVAIEDKNIYKKYKSYFDKNFKDLKNKHGKGYSFKIPKDLRPLPEIAEELKNKSSNTYKTFLKNLKNAASEFIDNVEQYDEKELFEKIKKHPQFNRFKRILPRLASNQDFSERRYAALNNTMTSGVQYVDDVEENWFERNPKTTAGGVGASSLLIPAVRKAVGTTLNLGFGPTGAGVLSYLLRPEDGYDLSRTGDRLGFEAEAALASPLVKGALSVTDKIKNQTLRKITERAALAGMSPALALRLARAATPLGIASLGLEGIYHLGKKGYEQRKLMEDMTEEEKRNFLAEQYEDVGGVFGEGA